MRQDSHSTADQNSRAVLVGVQLPHAGRAEALEHLAELGELAGAAGARPIKTFLQERQALDAACYLGRGKAEEIARWIEAEGVDMAIFDDELAPNQHRNLEQILGCRVLDRTLLVLDIFASRARTSEGKLQVELAQLSYLMPRLAGKGIELSRLGGGIGTRGPGEAKLETDRRRIRKRMAALRQELEAVRQRRGIHRSARRSIPAPAVALVGYTNAGKSTLFNALTRATTTASPKLFATLDPLVRGMTLGDGRLVLVSDTVGFIRKLPHQLVAAFRATLEEVTSADLLLHVVDASFDHYPLQVQAVSEVLASLGCARAPVIHVFNKTDLLEESARARLEADAAEFQNPVLASALTGEGLEILSGLIRSLIPDRRRRVLVRLPYEEQRLRALMHELGHVLQEDFLPDHVRLEALVDPALAGDLTPFLANAKEQEPPREVVDRGERP